MTNPYTSRPGSALDNNEAHEKDHSTWNRRTFLFNMGLTGGAALLLNRLPVFAFSNSPLSLALSTNNSDRILVLIRMKGGNDGLNTIIPLFDYSTYRANRPTIAIPENQVLKLNDEMGMHPAMNALLSAWEGGSMKVIHSVGYPDQNLSHFRSSDIWASASDSEVIDTSGWLGRWLDSQYPDFINTPPVIPPAIQIGGAGNNLFNNESSTSLGVVVSNPEQLAEIAKNGVLYDALNVPDCYYGEQLSYARNVANSTFRYAKIIADAYQKSENQVEYQGTLGEQLALVARLIKGNLGTQLYMVTIDGFDTHANQTNIHTTLLSSISNEIQKFYADLSDGDWSEKVLSMTYSEFGRRIEQNASQGTDHGAAAPLLLFGSGLNGSGFVGTKPDLSDVDNIGNLKFNIDFRQIYASVLEQWLCVDSRVVNMVLGSTFNRLPEIGLSCNSTTPTHYVSVSEIQHKAIYQDGLVILQYNIPTSLPLKIEMYNLAGQLVETFFDGFQYSGTHQIILNNRNLPSSIYVVSLKTPGRTSSQKVQIMR